MIDFTDHFLFFCTLKYANMIRISNISFFRFCWKNDKLDWPKCARTMEETRFKTDHLQHGNDEKPFMPPKLILFVLICRKKEKKKIS